VIVKYLWCRYHSGSWWWSDHSTLSSINHGLFIQGLWSDRGNEDHVIPRAILWKHSRASYFLWKQRRSCAARNFGANRAKGKNPVFTDSDIIIKRDTLEKAYDILTSSSDYQAVIGSYTKHTKVRNFFSRSKIIVIILPIKNPGKKHWHSGLDVVPYTAKFS